MIKAIIFDLGGVLFTDGTGKFAKYLEEIYGVAPADTRAFLVSEAGDKYYKGTITNKDFWDSFKNTLKVDEDAKNLSLRWINSYDLNQETLDLIERLSKECEVYYLSDNVKDRVVVTEEKYDFLKHFKDGIFSCDVGMRKPQPKIYDLALEMTKTKPEETIFIDDKESSLAPARDMGLHTVLFTNAEEVEDRVADIIYSSE
jgi:putative hydrolase of the HAD superfamily